MSRSFNSVSDDNVSVPKINALTPKVKFRKLPILHAFDASNWMCRAYFVAQNNPKRLTAPDGTPTGGVYIFLNMVEAMVQQLRKDPNGAYMAMCFDGRSKGTWRHRAMVQWATENPAAVSQVFPKSENYKGNRDRTKTPDLPVQMALAQEILQAYGIWAKFKSPYEADDILGTLSTRFSKTCFVDIYTRDKDCLQLVDNPRTQLIMAAQSNAKEKRFVKKNVPDHFGVPHNRIVDYLAMCGDTSDNVPGLPGVSDGTALKLLKEYGSLDNLIKMAPTIKSNAKWKKALVGDIPWMDMDLQKELVTIDRNVPTLPKNLSAFRIGEPDVKAIKDIKKRLNFKKLFEF